MERIVCEARNCHLKVVERVSEKGNKYKMVVAVINGKEINIAFHNVYIENALMHAGIKVEK